MILALLAALLLLGGGSALAAVDDLPCVLCHPSRDREAFAILSDTPGVAPRGESGQAFVCYSCHNGTVVDSRRLLWRGSQHPTAFSPSRPLPKGYPLYGNNQLECGTCHSPHGKGAGAGRWLRGSADGQASCAGCHRDWPEPHTGATLRPAHQRAVQNLGGTIGPGGKVVCGTCHRLHGAQGDQLLIAPYAAGKEALCFACHPELAGAGEAKGEAGGHPCESCHDVHGPAWPAQEARTAAARCAACHSGHEDRHLGRVLSGEAADAVRARGGLLEQGGKISCPTCHKVHGAAGGRLLLVPYGPKTDDFCRLCHRSVAVKGKPAGEASQPCADCHKPHSQDPLLFGSETAAPCAGCHPEKGKGAGDHQAANRACSECHSIHRPFLPPGSRGALLRMPLQGGALCQGCHPGLGKPHGPLTAIPEAEARRLVVRGLRLGPGGELECSACHRLHGAAEPRLLRYSRFLSCLYCHPVQNPYGADGLKAGTHPVSVYLRQPQQKALEAAAGVEGVSDTLECSSCHPAHSAGRGAPTCTACHPDQGAGDGHGGVKGCSACHSLHGNDAPEASCSRCHSGHGKGLHADGTVLAGVPLPAFDPKGRKAGKGTFSCSTCHDPHTSGRGLLRLKEPGGVCLACHPEKTPVKEGAHGKIASDRWPCGNCHPAHGAQAAEGDDPQGDACRRCHGADLRSLPNHGPTGEPVWKRVAGALPLFDRSGRRNPYGFLTCPTCHDVHQGAGGRALRKEARDPPDLCLACHPDKKTLLGSSHDPRGTGGGAACDVCHPIHSRGDQPPLWTLRVAAQGTWNDRMCSPCHGPPGGGPLPHSGPGSHPVNLPLPAALKPGLPLFDALGGRGGRTLAYSTCHDLHGTFGTDGKRIPRYLRRSAAAGDLCVVCHADAAAVLGTPHDLTKRWPSAAGPCGPCHVPHRGLEKPPLWGLQLGPSEYLLNAACRSCHRQGGPVPGEYLLLQYHMTDAEEILSPRGTRYLLRPMILMDEIALRTGGAPLIPLFDTAGTPAPDGNLQCVSCHHPHQWSPMGPFFKPGGSALGPNVATSFLRLKDVDEVSRSVCASCHASDAREKYLKYHQVWEEVGNEFQ